MDSLLQLNENKATDSQITENRMFIICKSVAFIQSNLRENYFVIYS